jgi:hypothetical protein
MVNLTKMTQLKKVPLLFRSEVNFMNSMLFGFALAMKILLKGTPANLDFKKNLTALVGLCLIFGILNFILAPPRYEGFLFYFIYYSTLVYGAVYFLVPWWFTKIKSEIYSWIVSIFALAGLLPFFYYVTAFTLLLGQNMVFRMDTQSFITICFTIIVRIICTWGAFYFFKKYYVDLNFERHFDNSIKLALNRIGFKWTYNKTDWLEFNKIPENKINDVDRLIGLELSYVSKYKFAFYLVLITLQIVFYIWIREKTGI